MFNTYVSNSETKYVPYEKSVNTTEHRAPTDESVELLNNFQEKALKNLLKGVVLNNNILSAVSVATIQDFTGFRIGIRFTLNDVSYEDVFEIKKYEILFEDEMKIVHKLIDLIRDSVSRIISEKIVNTLDFEQSCNEILRRR